MCNSPVHSYKWETKQIVKNFTKKPDRIHASGRIRWLPSVVSSQGRPLLCCSAIHSGYSFFHLSWQNCCSVESYSWICRFTFEIYSPSLLGKTKQRKPKTIRSLSGEAGSGYFVHWKAEGNGGKACKIMLGTREQEGDMEMSVKHIGKSGETATGSRNTGAEETRRYCNGSWKVLGRNQKETHFCVIHLKVIAITKHKSI